MGLKLAGNPMTLVKGQKRAVRLGQNEVYAVVVNPDIIPFLAGQQGGGSGPLLSL